MKPIRHDGTECPLPPDTMVVARYRDGRVSKAFMAKRRRWVSWSEPASSDIVAYRLATKDDIPE